MRGGIARAAAGLAALAMIGCGGEKLEAEPTVPLADVPAAAKEAAAKELPGVHFETAWKVGGGQGGEASYEIRGRDENGKTRELRVTASGKVLEVE
jgi:hypothetical protein